MHEFKIKEAAVNGNFKIRETYNKYIETKAFLRIYQEIFVTELGEA